MCVCVCVQKSLCCLTEEMVVCLIVTLKHSASRDHQDKEYSRSSEKKVVQSKTPGQTDALLVNFLSILKHVDVKASHKEHIASCSANHWAKLYWCTLMKVILAAIWESKPEMMVGQRPYFATSHRIFDIIFA